MLTIGVFSPSVAFANSPFDWPQFRESQTHQGNNPEVGTSLTASTVSNLTVAWTGATGAAVDSSPAITSGVIYVGSSNGTLYAYAAGCGTLGAVCTPIWTGTTGGAITSSPAVASGDVFVGSADGKLYAFKVGCGTGGATCAPDWTATMGGVIDSSPSVDQSVIYIGSNNGNLYAFDSHGVTGCTGTPKTCTPIWTATTGGAITASASEGLGRIWIASEDGKVYSFSGCATLGAECTPQWTANIGHPIDSSPAYSDGVLYIGAGDGKVYALRADCPTPTCSSLWSHSIGTAVKSSPTVTTGFVFVGSNTGSLYAFHLPVDHLVVSPATPSVPAGSPQTFLAEGFSNTNVDQGDVTAAANFTISGGATCNLNVCSSSAPGTFTVTATYGTATGTATMTVTSTGATYVPLTPARILDTRLGIGLNNHFRSHLARTFQVTGVGGVPANATAITGNLTVTHQTTRGFLYIGPNPTNDPGSSTLNFPVGDDRANGVDVALGAGGTLSVTFSSQSSAATADVVFDVSGYFVPGLTGATYHALTPTRLLDSRSGKGLSGPFHPHSARVLQVTGATVPPNATAVTGNLTVSRQTKNGFLYVGPIPTNDPGSSTLNFPQGDDRANNVTIALGSGGTLAVTFVSSTPTATTDAIFDVTGYFTADATGATYVPVTPARLLDSRPGGAGLGGAFISHAARTFQVTGSVVPANAIAVTGNLTVTLQTAFGNLYAGPVAQNYPGSSTLNFPKGDDRANGLTVALGAGGTMSVTYSASNLAQSTHAIFDVSGYFIP